MAMLCIYVIFTVALLISKVSIIYCVHTIITRLILIIKK